MHRFMDKFWCYGNSTDIQNYSTISKISICTESLRVDSLIPLYSKLLEEDFEMNLRLTLLSQYITIEWKFLQFANPQHKKR